MVTISGDCFVRSRVTTVLPPIFLVDDLVPREFSGQSIPISPPKVEILQAWVWLAPFMLQVIQLTLESAISAQQVSIRDMERFSELGELAELFESLKVDLTGDGIMQLLVADLFAGKFDPEVPKEPPSRYAIAEFMSKQTLAVPSMSFANRIMLMSGCARGGCRYSYGTSADIVAILWKMKALPFDTPERMTEDILHSTIDLLSKLPIQEYDERARDLLDCVMVDRTVLRAWFEAAGMMSPQTSSVDLDAANDQHVQNGDDKAPLRLIKIEKVRLKPGRPSSDLWPRVQELVTELHRENPEAYNNAMASEIHERLVAEFPEQNVLALTTIQGRMMSLRMHARAELDE